jgi:hypothetical protein
VGVKRSIARDQFERAKLGPRVSGQLPSLA